MGISKSQPTQTEIYQNQKRRIKLNPIKSALPRALGLMLAGLALGTTLYAGNPDRSGQAGATQLLINPWGRSSGWMGAGMAGIKGVESFQFNPAGLYNISGTEFQFCRTNWLGGSGININAFGLAQRVGGSGCLGLSVMSFDFGEIPVTTVNQPERTLGTYQPQMLNFALGYAKNFSNQINGGFVVKIVQEGLTDAKSQGLAIDAGIQYLAGESKRTKFSVCLKNVGPEMVYRGDGLTLRGRVQGLDYDQSLQNRSARFDMPSQLLIGGSYDFWLDSTDHVLTLAALFSANAFSNNEYTVGLEYQLMNYLGIRAGFAYQEGIFDTENRQTSFTGPAAGVTVQVPFGEDKQRTFGIDYSYRATMPFNGTHTFSIRLGL